jgi:carbon starvation protein CstA
VAVFINIPAQLLSNLCAGDQSLFWLMVGIIFAYYIAATLFPVDKIIGAVYPLFGAVLILSAVAIMCVLLYKGWSDPALLAESAAFQAAKFKEPILPMLFVTIACGILSGFHTTQSPIIARTVSSERQGRQAFYGMMVLEGVIAMIWAAGALAIYNMMPETLTMAPAGVLKVITSTFLGKPLLSLYIPDDPTAVAYGMVRMRHISLFLAVGACNNLLASCMNAFGYPASQTICSLVSVLGLRIVWMAFLFPLRPSIEMLYFCYTVSWWLLLVLLSGAFFIVYRKYKKGKLHKI